jgi:hypothetical protein
MLLSASVVLCLMKSVQAVLLRKGAEMRGFFDTVEDLADSLGTVRCSAVCLACVALALFMVI